MSELHTKLLRDLAALAWQIASIAAVVASGVAIFVASFGCFRALHDARARFYAETRFPDVFVRLTRAPDSVSDELARIDGVLAVDTRLAFDVPLDVDGADKPVAARILSMPRPGRVAHERLVVETGRLPEPTARHEVAVNEAFAKARRLALGDRIAAVLNGRREELAVVGTVLSAEHVAALRPGEILPDDAHYAILWLPYDTVASAYQAIGTFNEAVLALAPRADEGAVIADVDRTLAPRGGYGAHGRSEQTAHRFVDSELRELEVEATVLPVIFLGVAAFLVNIVLARLVAQERTVIATLRALGFRRGPIVRHYLELAAITAGIGALAGIGLGDVIGRAIIRSYAAFFRFPDLHFELLPVVVGSALVTSLAAATIGATAAVRRIAGLAPAEAMQAAAPVGFRTGAVSGTRFGARIPTSLRLVLRNVGRRPGRTFASIAGVGAAMAILVVGAFWNDAFDALLFHQFHVVQREDATVVFVRSVSDRAARELAHVDGIRAVEGIRAVPVRLRVGTRAKRVELLGLRRDGELHRLVARTGEAIELPPDGILLSRHLARRLGAHAGDLVAIEVLEGARPKREARVAAIADELVGMAAYADADGLARLLGDGPVVSAALVAYEPGGVARAEHAMKGLPGVATVSDKNASVRRFEETFQQIVTIFSLVLTAFGALIVAGVVYNAARILVAERARELATLRVVGFSRADVSEALLLELAIQVVLGLPIGAAAGWALAATAVRLFGPEDIAIPVVVAARTWVLAISVVLASAIASALAVRRRLDRMDLVAVLKVRE